MSTISVEDVKKVLGNIIDPDLGRSLAELDAVKEVYVKDSGVVADIAIPGPIKYVEETLYKECREALAKAFPDTRCDLSISEIAPDLSTRMFLQKVKYIIAVASGKGGVGKSSIAANVAAAMSKKGLKVGILDGDVYGPSQPTMFGLKNHKLPADTDSHGNTTAVPVEKDGIKVASMGFILDRDEAAIVRGPMLASYFSLLFQQIEWGELDVLVFDLPPGTGDIQLTLVQKIPLNGAIVVTTPQEIALADVRRSVTMFKRVNVDILGIVENMSYFVPPDMPDKKYYIFGQDGGKQIAEESGSILLGQVPLDMEMREGNDGGAPIVLSGKSAIQGAIIEEIAARTISELRKTAFKNVNTQVNISI